MAPNTGIQSLDKYTDFEEVPIGEMSYPDIENTKTESKYDPRKNYEWQPQDQFSFNGMEFNIMYNNLSQFMTEVTTPASILRLSDVFAVLQSKLINAVETGQVKERAQVRGSVKATKSATGANAEHNAKPESV